MTAYGEWCWISDRRRIFSFRTRDQAWSITQDILCSSFIKVRKGTEKASNIDIRRGMENIPVASLAAAAAKSLQSCLTLCDPIDSCPLGSFFPGILQARILEWVAISFSSAWKWKVKGKSHSCAQLLATTWTAAYQAPPSMGFSRQKYWSGLPLPSPKVLAGCGFSWDL